MFLPPIDHVTNLTRTSLAMEPANNSIKYSTTDIYTIVSYFIRHKFVVGPENGRICIPQVGMIPLW